MYRTVGCLLAILLLASVGQKGHASTYQQPGRGSLTTVPDTEPLEFLSARDELALSDTPAALKKLRRTLKKFPRHQPSITLYLRLLDEVKGLGSVREAARKQVDRVEDPSVLSDFFRSTRRDTGRYRPLMDWLYRENYVEPYINQLFGRLLIDNEEYRRAENVLGLTLRTHPSNTEIQVLYAEVLAHLSECSLALRHLDKIIGTRPGWSRPYLLKARILWGLDRQQARDVLEIYNSLTPPATVPDPRRRRLFECGPKGTVQ